MAKMAFPKKSNGYYEFTVTAERVTYRMTGIPDAENPEFRQDFDLTTTDRVTFRICPELDYTQGTDARGNWPVVGYRCMVFANGEIVFDDLGRSCARLAEARYFLRRLAEQPIMQANVEAALLGENFYVQRRNHEAAMAALNDYYGTD